MDGRTSPSSTTHVYRNMHDVAIVTGEPVSEPLVTSHFKCTSGRLAKFVVLVALVCALILAPAQIVSALKHIRGDLAAMSLSIVMPLYMLLDLLRKLFPPLYFCFPLSTFWIFYCVDSLGASSGAVVYLLARLEDIVTVVACRYLYQSYASRIFDDDTPFPFVLEDLRMAVRGIDSLWRHKFLPEAVSGNPWYTPCLHVALFVLTLYLDDYAVILWMAIRSDMDAVLYAISLGLGLVLDWAPMVIKMTAYQNVADSVQGDTSIFRIFKVLGALPVYQIVLGLLCVVVPTVYVQGRHILSLVRYVSTLCGCSSCANSTKPVADQRSSASEVYSQ
jgi:hypothetical protein